MDENKRKEFIHKYNALTNMHTEKIPHFIRYGTKAGMVNLNQFKEYIAILERAKANHQVVC